MVQVAGKRSIKSIELTSPNTVQIVFENSVTNIGKTPLNDIEFVLPLPEAVELPGTDEVTITLHGETLARENIETNKTHNDELPNYITFRVLLRNLNDAVGGLQPGEELTVIFPVYVILNIEEMVFKYPLLINALEGPESPLSEEIAIDLPLSYAHVNNSLEISGSDASIYGISFENGVIDKFAKLAVGAYNERKYEDALLYCDEILSVAQTLREEALIQNFSTIRAKLIRILAERSNTKAEEEEINPIQ